MGPDLHLLMAVDESYLAPLSVTVRSLVDHLPSDARPHLHLLSDRLAPEMAARLEVFWDHRIRLHFIRVDAARLVLPSARARTVMPVACYRILAASALADLSRVIYLDADLLVCADLTPLWLQPMNGRLVLAVQDGYLQRLPSGGAAPAYFNSGVLVIDLDGWRAAGVERACLEALGRLHPRSRWLDQDALNHCLAGRWGALPPVWNKQYTLDLLPDWRCSPYTESEFYHARNRPLIVHFCGRTKPWHAVCDHEPGDVALYRALLDASPLRPVRLAPPSKLAEFFARPHRRLLDLAAAMWRSRRRRYAVRTMLLAALRVALLCPWTLVSVPFAVLQNRLRLPDREREATAHPPASDLH